MTPPGMGSESPRTCTYGFAVKSIDEDTRTVTARLTDASLDRMAEVIPLAAWRTPLPASVPALWAHDWSRPALGRWHGLQIGGDGMYGRATFAAAGTHPDADLVYGLVKAGVIRDVSVGFRAQREVGRDGTVQYRDAELLEASFCNIGANPHAVVVARALGFDPRRFTGPSADIALFTLDDEDVGLDARDVREAIRLVVPAMARAAVAQQRGRLDDRIDLDAIDDDFDPLRHAGDRAMLVDAMRTVLPQLVRVQLNKLRGRVD